MIKVTKLCRGYDAKFETFHTFQSKISIQYVTDNTYIYMVTMGTKCHNRPQSVESDHLWDDLQVNFFLSFTYL